MMDLLDDRRIEKLKANIGLQVRGLLGGKVDVMFLDATTLAFASESRGRPAAKGIQQGRQAAPGSGGSGAASERRRPSAGVSGVPGNTADVKTLQPMVEQFRREYDLGRVVVVADAGMGGPREPGGPDRRAGFDWVVSAPLRKLKEADLAVMDRVEEWPEMAPGETDGKKDDCRLFDHRVSEGRDGGPAAGAPLQLEEGASGSEEPGEGGGEGAPAAVRGREGDGEAGRFLRVERGAVAFNEEAVRRDARFDGIHGVYTSLSDPPEVIRAHYAGLWSIEHGFRVLKNTLGVRPVFHWTERRVRAHLAICYAAFALLRILRWRHLRHHSAQARLSEGAHPLRVDRGAGRRWFGTTAAGSAT